MIERLIQAHPELAYSGDHVHTTDKTKRDYYALFECGIDPRTREYLSEDFGFCRLWRNLGGNIWLDVEAPLTHTGTHDFVGAPALRYGSSEPWSTRRPRTADAISALQAPACLADGALR